MESSLSYGLRLAALLLSLSFGLAPARADSRTPNDQQVGFYLLRHTCDQETQVNMIGMVKTMPPEIAAFTKHVSQVAHDSMDTIQRLEEGDRSLKIEDSPLPRFEDKVRDSIRADKQHQLLFGTKGSDFVRALLVTQIEASTYIVNIARDLAKEDSDADRAQTLRKLSDQWLALRGKGFRLLDAQ